MITISVNVYYCNVIVTKDLFERVVTGHNSVDLYFILNIVLQSDIFAKLAICGEVIQWHALVVVCVHEDSFVLFVWS